MAEAILASFTVTATEVKRQGVASFETPQRRPVAIVKNNRPTHYVLPADLYAQLLDRLEAAEDAELNRIADARMHEPSVEVSLDDL